MSEFEFLRVGNADEKFVLTRRQLRELADSSFRRGSKNSEQKPATFAYECKLSVADEWSAEQVARSKWLHIVTANHLRRARKTIRELRLDNKLARAELRLWRGSEHRKCDTPGHYAGDGIVTCSRAMESASAQRSVVPQSAMQRWWWMCAFKYVWRMWSKGDPAADARKAIDCLRKCMEEVGAAQEEPRRNQSRVRGRVDQAAL